MKILYLINAGIMGGRERHVMTLVRSLPKEIEYCICAVSAGEATEAMQSADLNVRVLGGCNGHDVRVLPRFIQLVRDFKPDVVHAHSGALIPYMVMRFFPEIALVQSVHGPSVSGAEWAARRKSIAWKMKTILSWILERKPDYYLPVSQATWDEFKIVHPNAKGEVFFNALNLDALPVAGRSRGDHPADYGGQETADRGRKIIGMVGRMADVKDWPSFAKIARLVKAHIADVEVWGIGASEEWAHKNVGEDARYVKWFGSRQDARELIAQMDVFVLTSKYEQLPTTLLEAFALHVSVAGFLPEGGTSEVLALAQGCEAALMNKERDCGKAADAVIRILSDDALYDNMVREGDRIVHEYFDMKKLCATQLMEIYNRIIKEKK
mgnify:CR=1 FL=1